MKDVQTATAAAAAHEAAQAGPIVAFGAKEAKTWHYEGQNQRIHAHQVLAVRLHEDGGRVVLKIRFPELVKHIGICKHENHIVEGDQDGSRA